MRITQFHQVLQSWGAEFKEASIKYSNAYLSVKGEGASMAYRQHFIDLDPTYTDDFGDPLARITFDFEEQDRQLTKYLAEKCEQILKEMGADHIDTNKDLGPYNVAEYQSTHNTGGVIMGAILKLQRLITILKCGIVTIYLL